MPDPTKFRGRVAADDVTAGGNTLKMGAAEVTGATLDVATGLSRVLGAVVTINEDPGATAGDVFTATATFSGGTVRIAIWQDDATAATEDTSVSWFAWGTA